MKQIEKLWTWFQANEQEFNNALLLGINTDEVLAQFSKKLYAVSRRISFIVKVPNDEELPIIIVFTGGGYRKLFDKLIALEEMAPKLEMFRPQAFIKPLDNVEEVKLGLDDPIFFEDYEIKISDVRFNLLDFNIKTKQLKLTIYLPYYDELKDFEDLYDYLEMLLMEVLGEIKYKKHIKYFEVALLPEHHESLLPLVELQDYIDYLYTINSRKKPRTI